MGEITETPENMRQTMELLERELAGRNLSCRVHQCGDFPLFAQEYHFAYFRLPRIYAQFQRDFGAQTGHPRGDHFVRRQDLVSSQDRRDGADGQPEPFVYEQELAA